MNSITLNADAKINLYLDVTGRREDGYHLLETVMHSVSLCDKVTVSRIPQGIEIICSDSDIPCDERNIAYKCADAFFRYTGISDCGIRIKIVKHIPSQAGMGGGSSDGAAVLRGMNMIFGAKLSTDKLCFISSSIGADIPFCIKGGCGYCTGIGEIITPLPKISGYILIGKGNEGISTKEAFRKIDSTEQSIGMKNVYETFYNAVSISDISHMCRNIFDDVTALGEVNEIKKTMLENKALACCMTGSGSAVFGLYTDHEKASAAKKILAEKGFFSDVCEFTSGNDCPLKE